MQCASVVAEVVVHLHNQAAVEVQEDFLLAGRMLLILAP
jgi:hypothetical protein